MEYVMRFELNLVTGITEEIRNDHVFARTQSAEIVERGVTKIANYIYLDIYKLYILMYIFWGNHQDISVVCYA